MTRFRFLIQTIGMLLFDLSHSVRQLKAITEIGGLEINHEHAAWPSPESIVRDLRSPSEDVRLKALEAVRVPKALMHRAMYSSNPDGTPKVNGSVAIRPEQIELRYAALGSDETQQAVVAVQVSQYAYAAVATPKGNGWERIAQFSCWCK